MNKRIVGQLGISAAFLLIVAVSAATAAPQYALAVSSSALYQVRFDGTTMSNIPIFSFGNSNWGRAITTYTDNTGDYVLVTEVGSSGSSIRKLQLTGTGAVEIGTPIDLTSGVRYANSIAVDSNNGIYVGDSSSGTARYAYIPTLSGTVSVNAISNHAPLRDVATAGATGIIISQHDSSVSDVSFITTLTDGVAGTTKSLEAGTDYPRYPVAVAAHGNNAYVVSEVMTSVMSGNAALSVYDIIAGTAGTPIPLEDFLPTDVTTFSTGGTDYVALIGKTSGGLLQAWRATSDNLTSWLTEDIGIGADGGSDFQCTASYDGNALWFSQPSKNSVGVLDTNTWTYSNITDVGDQITGLVAFTPTMVPVPEPSSLLALASMAAGALGFFKRRKNA